MTDTERRVFQTANSVALGAAVLAFVTGGALWARALFAASFGLALLTLLLGFGER